MKIKTKEMSYSEVCALTPVKQKNPVRQSRILRRVMYLLSKKEWKETSFSYEEIGMEALAKGEPCLILMNHSSFTDLQIIAGIFRKRQYHIVCTNDGFIGKSGFMRRLGCIPAGKFITDIRLVKSMLYCVRKLKSSVVMYPEASYSFDGSETPLPLSLGKFLKQMQVPVVMVKTQGAFLRDPLYNCLQKRKTKVSATVKYLLSKEQIASMDAGTLNRLLAEEFSYDHFRDQKARGVKITEKFRADGLQRVLYKCPCCREEGQMVGKGVQITCTACNKSYTLGEDGLLSADSGDTEFAYVTDWYSWERACVKQEIIEEAYRIDVDVDIYILADMKAVYHVGEGHLLHTKEGFHLTGCEGELDYSLKSSARYSLYADYFWYEIGDMISIGDMHRQYYCFPKNQKNAPVAKARLATEEIYKLLTAALS